MRSMGKVIVTTAIFLGLIAWSSPSQTRGGHHHTFGLHYGHRGYGLHFGHGFGHHGLHGGYHRYYYPYRHRYYSYPYRYGRYYYPKRYRYYDKPSEQGRSSSNSHESSERYHLSDSRSNRHTDLEAGSAHGLELLSRERAAEALELFGRLARANPSKGLPKAGYALASAELGRLSKGIWAMRRALRFEPNALHYVNLGEDLRAKVEGLTLRYKQSPQYSDNEPGSSFMLAVLYYLLGDMNAAQLALEQNRNSSDDSTSAKNLARLIEEDIRAQSKPDKASGGNASKDPAVEAPLNVHHKDY